VSSGERHRPRVLRLLNIGSDGQRLESYNRDPPHFATKEGGEEYKMKAAQ
jgi:hypothetical protein